VENIIELNHSVTTFFSVFSGSFRKILLNELLKIHRCGNGLSCGRYQLKN